MLQTKNPNNVVLNTPSNFDLSLFNSIKSKADKHKLIFLIHQINHWTVKDKTFKMHKKAYYETLGLSPNRLNELLNILIQHDLIEQISVGFSKTDKITGALKFAYSQFRMITPFQVETSVQHQYIANTAGCPKFINSLVANDWHVRPTEKSLYKPEKKTKVVSSIDELPEVIALRKENEELKETIMALKNTQIQPSTVDDVDLIIKDEDVLDEVLAAPVTTLESVKMNRVFKVEFAPSIAFNYDLIEYLSTNIIKSKLFYTFSNYNALIIEDRIKINVA